MDAKRLARRAPPLAPTARRLVGAAVVAALSTAACIGSGEPGTRAAAGETKETIVVGVSGAFTENRIVAELYAQVLEAAGYTVDRQFTLRSREISQNALESGQIDLKPEYLSSLLLFIDPNARSSSDPAYVAAQDARLLRPRGVTVLKPSSAQDRNEFVANRQTAERYHITTMSALASVAGRLTLGGPPECPQRPFCLPGLNDVYGIVFNDFEPLDAGGPQTVAALRRDSVQVGLLFSTDPSIDENGFVPLVDDKHLQNAENITPVMRSDKLNDEIRRLLDRVSARLSTRNVTELIGRVVVDGQPVGTVAEEFLRANGLL